MRTFVLSSALFAVLSSSLASAADKPRLAVTNVEARGVDTNLAKTVTDTITTTLDNQRVFTVISEAEIRQMLAFETTKQQMGCGQISSCMAELAGALGLSLSVAGALAQVGSDFVLTLTLTSTERAEVLSRQRRQVSRAEELPAATESAVAMLVRDLLQEQSGKVALRCSEPGANVMVDGGLIGVTPLAPELLTGGPHEVRIVKQGFVAWAKDVYVRKGEPLELSATLVPSQEFVEAYTSRASTIRTSSWVAGGLGLVSVGLAVGGSIWNNGRAADLNRQVKSDGCAVGATPLPEANCDDLRGRGDAITTMHRGLIGAGVLGGALLATATGLFLFGPDPGRYNSFSGASLTNIGIGVEGDKRFVWAEGVVSW